jgi:hypothetical protein
VVVVEALAAALPRPRLPVAPRPLLAAEAERPVVVAVRLGLPASAPADR